jgi:predicted HNH restriction endonuclease
MTRREKRTYADRREYLIQAVSERRRKIKRMALEYKGGKCEVCGYDKHQGVLDFHHIKPEEKLFAIGTGGHSRSWERVQTELDKCVLVCANCHREIELGITKIPSKIV